MTAKYRPRYTVRKQSSGYTASVSYYVWDTVNKGRVCVHANRFRDSAQASADTLNIIELITPHAEDDRPYEVRLEEATAKYRSLTVPGKPLIEVLS